MKNHKTNSRQKIIGLLELYENRDFSSERAARFERALDVREEVFI